MADQLVTPSELASFLQQDVDTATANLLINLATAKVQAACGQRLVSATSTFVIDVDMCECDHYLALPQMPVRSVGSVLIDGVADTTWLLRSQRLWRLYGWNTNPNAPTQVTVQTVAHGYLAGAQGLELARDYTFALAGAGYSNPSGGAVQSEQIDDYRVSYADADARMQVSPFMRDQLRAAYGSPAYVTSSR
jgi:hypothetical protein